MGELPWDQIADQSRREQVSGLDSLPLFLLHNDHGILDQSLPDRTPDSLSLSETHVV